MKRVTCKQLGGACDLVFEANTFKEAASLSQQHGMEMAKANDQAHLDAMEKMQVPVSYTHLRAHDAHESRMPSSA